MWSGKHIVVIGGTSGIGRGVAEHYVERGAKVTLSGCTPGRAKEVASGLGGRSRGIDVDLSSPLDVALQLAEIEPLDRLVIAAIERDSNGVRDYDLTSAIRLTTLKLVGYTAVVHALGNRLRDCAAIVLLGGLAMRRPYPGSTTVTTVNAGITGLVRTLAAELAPVRVNAVHPSIVGDSPYWRDKPQALEVARQRTLTGRSPTTTDVVDAIAFLLDNPSMNGHNLEIDGGALIV